jgi:hypothetical protein
MILVTSILDAWYSFVLLANLKTVLISQYHTCDFNLRAQVYKHIKRMALTAQLHKSDLLLI